MPSSNLLHINSSILSYAILFICKLPLSIISIDINCFSQLVAILVAFLKAFQLSLVPFLLVDMALLFLSFEVP